MRRLLALFVLTGACAAPQSAPVTPAARTKAIVEPVHISRTALFYGEREMLRRTIAEHLGRISAQRLAPLSDLELEVVRATAVKEAAECAAPTSRQSILHQRHPDALWVRSSASCADTPCTLTVQVLRPPAGGTGAWTTIERWQATLPPPRTAQDWITAVGSLAPAPAPTGGLFGVLGEVADTKPPVEVLSVASSQAWKTLPTKEDFAAAQAGLDRCHEAGWSSASNDQVALEISPRGAVARCEGFSHRDAEDPRRMKCLCHALRKMTFEPGPRGRRLDVGIINHTKRTDPLPKGVSARLEDVQGMPPYTPYPDLARSAPDLARCALDQGQAFDGRVKVSLQVDGTGHVQEATVAPGQVSAPLAACFEAALARAVLPCSPKRAPFALSATYQVRVP